MKGGRELDYQSMRSHSPPWFQAGAKAHLVPEVQAVRSVCSQCAGALLVSQQPLSRALHKYTSQFLLSFQSIQFQMICSDEKKSKNKPAAIGIICKYQEEIEHKTALALISPTSRNLNIFSRTQFHNDAKKPQTFRIWRFVLFYSSTQD